MSFVPGFAPDAKSQWRELEIDLQELVLDEIERITANPPSPPDSVLYHDLTYDAPGARHYLFLRTIIDSPNAKITVVGIAHFVRPRGG